MQDLRYAFRTLIANPGFTIVAVLCLSLGIGVNGTIFSVVDGVLLQPYPYPDAERIVVLSGTNPKQNINRSGVSYSDYKDWRDQTTSFSGLCRVSATQPDDCRRRRRARALSRAPPSRRPSSACSAHRRRSGATSPRPTTVRAPSRSSSSRTTCGSAGTAATARSSAARSAINGRPHTVIGVMPQGFRFPENAAAVGPDRAVRRGDAARRPRTTRCSRGMKPGVTMAAGASGPRQAGGTAGGDVSE